MLRVRDVCRVIRSDSPGTPIPLTAARSDGTGESLAIAIHSHPQGGGRALVLTYAIGRDPHTSSAGLVALRQPFGGVRWWFACSRCRRLVRALYLPPAATAFACRRCHDLTWRSVQRPVEARYRQLCKGLATFVADLDHADPYRRDLAIFAVRALLDSALARGGSPTPSPSGSSSLSTL